MKEPMLQTFKALLLIAALYIVPAYSQSRLKFDAESYDFGELTEGDPASHEFEVTNTGKEPLLISNVQPSCGCTTPDWTKSPILPGAKGKIKATYNTAGRPGGFNKSITVVSNAETPSVTLYIKGSVIKKEEKPTYTENELKMSPKIILSRNEHHFGKVERGQKVGVKIEVKNLGKSDLFIKEVTSACNCVSHTLSKPSVKSGETAILELIYSPRSTNETTDVVNIKSNDVINYNSKVILRANVVESLATQSILKESKGSIPFK